MTVRIPKARITGLYGALIQRFTKKWLGQVPDALGVMWHSVPVLKAFNGLGARARQWSACDAQLKSLAHMAAVSMVGCSFCLDFAYFQAFHEKLDVDKAREVPRWRSSELFSPLEREVLAYAEAMTQTPPATTDEQVARLLAALGPAALVELTAMVGFANLTGRCNTALGIEAQGFSAACGLRPLAEPDRAVPSVA